MDNKTELGSKAIPHGNSTTAKAAVQFAGMGINLIRSLPAPILDADGQPKAIPLPEAEVIGRICAGNFLYAQGLELLLKLVFMAERISDGGYKQHALTDRFKEIKQLQAVYQNIERYMPDADDKHASALEVVRESEDSFMTSRYIGLRPDNLKSINHIDAAGLLLAITSSYTGLEQVEAARLVGISIMNLDRSPINSQSTSISKK